MRYEIREMSFGEILDTGFRLLRNHFTLLFGIGFAVALPLQLVQWVIVSGEGATAVAAAVGLVLFGLVALPVGSAAITWALAEFYLGRRVGLGEALRAALGMLAPLIGTGLLTMLAVMVGFMLLVIPGLYLAVAFLLVYQVCIVERRFGFDAMKRSRELMQGAMWRGIGLLLVVMLVGLVLQIPAAFLAVAGPLAQAVALAAVSAIQSALQSAVLIVFYFSERCAKEAYDLEHLAQEVQAVA